MKKYFYLHILFLLFASCEENILGTDAPSLNSQETVISLLSEDITLVETRTATPDMALPDGKVERVMLFAFDQDGGTLLASKEQEINYPDNEIRMLLPKNKNLELHAVCNVGDEWINNIKSLQELHDKMIVITKADDVFRGSLMMHGAIKLTAEEIAVKGSRTTINVRRLGSHISMDIHFAPHVPTDKFYLTEVLACNQPDRSWVISRPGSLEGNERYKFDSNDGDATYDAQPDIMKTRYLQNQRLSIKETPTGSYQTSFYQFENRRGGLDNSKDWFDMISDANPQKEILKQVYKGKYAEEYFPLGSYVLIKGTYVADNGKVTYDSSYKVYLGTDNHSDFNIQRNSRYAYTVTIRSCDELDTRVDAIALNQAMLAPSFASPLDAHCNAGRCLAYAPGSWEIFVENPDQVPWLEISFAPRYVPHPAGQPYTEEHATTRLQGEQALLRYFYIHTDEYVPEALDESGFPPTEADYRSGVIVLRDRKNGKEAKLTITQRPAQPVVLPRKDLLGNIIEYHKYYVEHTLEEKNLQWGFLKYPANPIMTSMINDRWDGLSNTRKLYSEATKEGGMYNPAGADPTTIDIPQDIALGYAIRKNRDRNGNGRIDSEEIVWYMPALDELAELRRAMDENHLLFENDQDKFWSSTPYLAGYTDEIPGRAFYTKMRNGEKAFAMRNRYYNVICCRRQNAWTGNDDSGGNGNIDLENPWEEEEEIMPVK